MTEKERQELARLNKNLESLRREAPKWFDKLGQLAVSGKALARELHVFNGIFAETARRAGPAAGLGAMLNSVADFLSDLR